MILALTANRDSFRSIRFGPGLNVVLADRTREATRKDSRNGLGKSMLIEVLHFCLGSSSGLPVEPLAGWAFSVELRLGGEVVKITRRVDEPRHVVVEGDTKLWPLQPTWSKSLGGHTLSLRDWTSVLGTLMFGLPPAVEGSKYQPSFRSLISYFVRHGRDAFSRPFAHYRQQQEVDIQVNIAYLLGIAWEDARDVQLLKDKQGALKDLRKAVKTGLLQGFERGRGDLEATRTRLQETAAQEAARLTSFKVHPQYTELRERANDLTGRIHGLTNRAVTNRQLLSVYERDLAEERTPDEAQLERVYAEAGVVLPERLVRRLDDVRAFHRKVVENRRSFLAEEVSRLKHEIAALDAQTEQLSNERAELMELLRTHGALEEYTGLQRLHLDTVEQVKRLDTLILNWSRLESGVSEVKVEQELLQQRGRRDYDERAAIRARAVTLFNANSEALYAAPGRLRIDFLPKGFDFGVDIERSGSDGIEDMKIFCFDLMLAQLWSEKPQAPGLLVHDSRLFDPVDERQKALALQRAAREAEAHTFQYICTLNSDAVPWSEFDKGFDLKRFVRLTLTDAEPAGSLFGFRF